MPVELKLAHLAEQRQEEWGGDLDPATEEGFDPRAGEEEGPPGSGDGGDVRGGSRAIAGAERPQQAESPQGVVS